MDRDFRNGYLDIDFPTEPFTSPIALLLHAVRLFAATFPFLAAVTLAVFLPGKLVLQLGCYLMDVPRDGILSYLVLEMGDLFLGALVAPAIVYGMVQYCRKGRTPPIGESLRWGQRQWLRMLGNKLKVEVTVTLWGALMVIPGIVAMIRLIFTDVIVAIEGDRERDVLGRSRTLSHGRRWRIFFALLPMMILDLAAVFLMLDGVQGATHSRILFAIAESLLAVAGQLGTVAILLMYLGVVQRSIKKLNP